MNRMIKIEACGNTYEKREGLKKLNFKWDGDYKKWYFTTDNPEEAIQKGKSLIDMGLSFEIYGHKLSGTNTEYSFWCYPRELEGEENYNTLKDIEKKLYFYEYEKRKEVRT